ncbi:hypothetical protein PR048_033327 [Dryococelus australis]|uniref:Ribosomal protein L2 n=1 Tax=Dryococelus australis TaxID=614101 RepID=A0ABQ9FZZ3_9NEOP|nr:hypothetical protein PR048_033327 [Dryococelus australis]
MKTYQSRSNNTYLIQHLHKQHYTDTDTDIKHTTDTSQNDNNCRPLCLRRGWRVTETSYGLRLGIVLFCSAPYSPRFTLTGSQDIDVKSRPDLFTHSLTHYWFTEHRLAARDPSPWTGVSRQPRVHEATWRDGQALRLDPPAMALRASCRLNYSAATGGGTPPRLPAAMPSRRKAIFDPSEGFGRLASRGQSSSGHISFIGKGHAKSINRFLSGIEPGSTMWESYKLEWGQKYRLPGWLNYSPPTKANHVRSRAAQYRWLAGFIGGLQFTPHLHSGVAPSSPHFTLIGSQDLGVTSRPNLFTYSIGKQGGARTLLQAVYGNHSAGNSTETGGAHFLPNIPYLTGKTDKFTRRLSCTLSRF